ncbi:hypothetical protein BGW36DRAFT_214605 [Talaromyces proteolyticus]|uniref:DUF2406 domain-containing protein n=1 Tax=Talaromyces proteolyticus TaxID=1131652 RepID=A0AAD4KJU0_9EURO|nr:uncharacterized protein BGW36DRAFT_214605 [Talaromyces proteolyticus]KAH8694035.1 hypothetical protein BGW36DRAFT_214605 [Talaromyces proteolyticus]
MATRYDDPPLPSPPPSAPARHGRGFSFSGKSEKSHRSSGSGPKQSLTETHEEKLRRSLHTKADPTLAMNEAQPAVVALEKSNLVSLREISHKDHYGNVITDPDRSNPTRPRLERPLETIRSFEAAIDGSYSNRRMSYVTAPSNSRPGSYYGGNGGGGHGSNNYSDTYNGRPANSRPESYVDYGASSSNHYPYNQHTSRASRPRYGGRMNSDYNNGGSGQHFYPNSSYQRSNDNVTAGSGSANTDQWGNSTDPSSVNSSFDRLQQQAQSAQQKQDIQRPPETYGFNGFPAGPQVDTSFQAPPPPVHRQPGYVNGANGSSGHPLPPPPLSKDLNQGVSNARTSLRKAAPSNTAPAATASKRTSWFKRRFSKND